MISIKLKKYFWSLFFISSLSYLFVHYLTMTSKSGVDYLYSLLIVIGLIMVVLSLASEKKLLKILSINFIIFISFIIILEISFLFRIIGNVAILPLPIDFNNTKPNVVRLDKSPWFKFSANKKIFSVGWRGSDFVYTWMSDSLGYKNIETQPGKKKFDYLALGDSFTEGMGTLVEHTWPSIINTISSNQVYNAGVQGYASSQFLGTLNYFHEKASFDGVIVGYSPYIYPREINFLTIPKKATGGIESIRINQGHKGLVIPQLLKILGHSFKQTFFWQNPSGHNHLSYKKIKDFLSPKPVKIGYVGRRDFIPYINEIKDANLITGKNDLKNNNNWKTLIETYKKIAKYCKLNNKKLIIAGLPFRREVYFTPSFQGVSSKFDTSYYIEFELLKEELSEFDIKFVDTFPALALYSKEAPIDKLPYFEKDGHFSRYGNKIIAKAISSSF